MLFYGTSGSSGDGFGDQDELHVNIMDGGGVEFYIEGGDNDVNPQAPAVNDDAWHHITATWDINSEAKLYVDGGEPVSVPHTANEFILSGTIHLGRPTTRARSYTGLIDDVRLYNYVLSPDEIALIMRGDVALAWNPSPANGSTSNIDDVTSVSWSAGDNAAQHDVYLGTDMIHSLLSTPDFVCFGSVCWHRLPFRVRQSCETIVSPEHPQSSRPRT